MSAAAETDDAPIVAVNPATGRAYLPAEAVGALMHALAAELRAVREILDAP